LYIYCTSNQSVLFELTLGHYRQLVVIRLLAGHALAISVPTVIDRSMSLYILEKIQQRGGGIKLDRFAAALTKEYMAGHRLVDVRFTEQAESGTLEIVSGCVELTVKGKALPRYHAQ